MFNGLFEIHKVARSVNYSYKYKADLHKDDGRSISRNVAYLNILVHDMINLLYYKADQTLFFQIPLRDEARCLLTHDSCSSLEHLGH